MTAPFEVVGMGGGGGERQIWLFSLGGYSELSDY